MHCKSRLALCLALVFSPLTLQASDVDELRQQLELLKYQLQLLEQKIEQQEKQLTAQQQSIDKVEHSSTEVASTLASMEQEAEQTDGISLGGAIRTTYSHTSYSDGNKNRGGDFAFDIFRLNLHGSIGDVLLNAEIRFFDYMTAVKYAYVGYQLNEEWQVQAGITQVPFGNWPYNSHNWFFSTNYYIGLEDDHDLGILFKRRIKDNWQLDLAFFKNDELGGVDGYVSSRADRYSYDVVGFRLPGDGIYDDPAQLETSQALGEYNTLSGRFAYHFDHREGFTTEVGVSALSGGLHDGLNRAGDYNAWAVHLNSHFDRWNLQLQHGEYRYNVDGIDRMAVGAYAFYDSIAAKAKTSTFNLAYSLPVEWGPVTGLQFYNNYGLVHDKSDNTADTWMNVTGFSVAAGGFFSYFDLVHARNQPFVGGSIAGDSNDTERRFNINIGYYF